MNKRTLKIAEKNKKQARENAVARCQCVVFKHSGRVTGVKKELETRLKVLIKRRDDPWWNLSLAERFATTEEISVIEELLLAETKNH